MKLWKWILYFIFSYLIFFFAADVIGSLYIGSQTTKNSKVIDSLSRLYLISKKSIFNFSGISSAHAQSGKSHNLGDYWKALPGRAKDIGIGGNLAWVVGYTPSNGGYGIYRWNGRNWEQVNGAAVRIDVGSDGIPWVVNDEGKIFRRRGNRWEVLPGRARDIGIGADNSVWVIGWTRTSGGYGIYRWNGRNWEQVNGGATQISVASDGRPWVVNSAGIIYKRVLK